MKENDVLQKIISSSKNQWDVLYRIARYIEEYNAIYCDNYWDEKIQTIPNQAQRIYYKVWMWLNYVQAEQRITKPIQELKEVFNTAQDKVFWGNIENENYIESEVLVALSLEGERGQQLLAWAKNAILFDNE